MAQSTKFHHAEKKSYEYNANHKRTQNSSQKQRPARLRLKDRTIEKITKNKACFRETHQKNATEFQQA